MITRIDLSALNIGSIKSLFLTDLNSSFFSTASSSVRIDTSSFHVFSTVLLWFHRSLMINKIMAPKLKV